MASRHRGLVRSRTTWLFLVFALFYAAVAARLVWIQVADNDRYIKWAARIRSRYLTIPASRGRIFDRNGRELAVNIETASVYANMKEVRDLPATAVRVAAILGTEPQTIEEMLNGGQRFIWIGRQLDPRIGDRVWHDRRQMPGIGIQRDAKRVYPAGKLAAQVVGFTNIDNKGAEGMESVENDTLAGRDGLMRAELDDKRRVIPETRCVLREPKNGKDICLTIDITIQHIAEQALARMAEVYHPRSACAVVMDPRTFQILAIANLPTFDPNSARSVKSGLWRNRAVADLYEPGSTLKVVTVAAGLNAGLSPNATMACCKGCEMIGRSKLPCSLHHPFERGHGAVNMYKIIKHSCNIGAAHIALRIGARKLYDCEEAFGLIDKVHAGFGCEAVFKPAPPERWERIRLANVGFGQGLAVTPLQMAGVYATIANGGYHREPHVIREIREADGTLCGGNRRQPGRRVISRAAAAQITKMLVGCVEGGTGKNARIAGRTVAGKTGSAQVVRVGGRGFEKSAFVASFMGFAPAGSPKLVVAVIVHRPQGSHFGATVAAPVFKEIMEKTLWYLKVPADRPSEQAPPQKQEGDQKRLV